jgi:transposase
MDSMPAPSAPVTVGVDTHLEVHVAAVIDRTGRLLGTQGFPASTRGYVALVTWAEGVGAVEHVGVEGTGTYGAGLARFVRAYGLQVVEVARPDRSTRRRRGKSDPIDAQAAARATLAGVATATPKTREGQVEMIRVLRLARRGAMKARVAAAAQLYGVLCSAPEELRQALLGLRTKALVGACAALRPGPLTSTTAATKTTLGILARRWQQLQAELDGLDTQLQALVTAAAPALVALPGVGVETAGQLLVTAGDNPQRLRSEAAFAHLCGAAPIPASSGRTDRHRLNRGGDRRANNALWRIALVRMRCHQPTRPTCSGAPTRACPSSTSCAASSATSPARSTTSSQARRPPLPPLAQNRRHQPPLSHGSATVTSMGHLLGYARVSTTDQQPHLQVDALEHAGCYRVFTEMASGARADRPVLEQVLDQLRPGDTLVVWKLDRLGRSLRHLVDTVTGLAECGIGFRSLQESIDTTTPGGKLVFHVFAALAEFERDLVRERTSAGLAAAAAGRRC